MEKTLESSLDCKKLKPVHSNGDQFWVFIGGPDVEAQYVSKFGELSSGHRTGKGQFSFQAQRKVIPKNVQTTAQLHSSHTLVQ